MRRIVLSFAVLGSAALSACSGGGSVLSFDNNSKPDRTIVTVQAPSNLARVLPGASLPLSATPVRGSQNGYVQGNSFKWSAALTTGQTYNFTAEGNQQRACASLTVTVPGGAPTPFTTDMNVAPFSTITVDPTNSANILFTPPAILPVPAGLPAGTTVQPNFPYCVLITATPTGGSAANAGSILVVVVNPAAPTQ